LIDNDVVQLSGLHLSSYLLCHSQESLEQQVLSATQSVSAREF